MKFLMEEQRDAAHMLGHMVDSRSTKLVTMLTHGRRELGKARRR
jgi:hypothetical protein